MLVHIQSKHFSLTEPLSKYINSKVQVMISRYETKIISINVDLLDVIGPEGGDDKCCKIIVKINSNSSIVVQETAEDLYDAINICTRLARRQVKRQLTFNVRTRRKIREVLLLASKEVEMQSPVN
jgi:putative sigma-54 modulation protein